MPGETFLFSAFTNIPDGSSGPFSTSPNFRVNETAVVAFTASNDFSFGKLKRNTNTGTATLAVNVPGSGSVSLGGKGLKPVARAGGGAVDSKAVTGAGTVKLRIKAKGKKKRKLNRSGKVRVKAKVTFTPNGVSSGDVPGTPNTLRKRIKLLKTG